MLKTSCVRWILSGAEVLGGRRTTSNRAAHATSANPAVPTTSLLRLSFMGPSFV